MSICFSTKCWGGDWEKMISGGLERKWQTLGYDFDSIDLYLNNGIPEGASEAFIGIADRIIDVSKVAGEVMQYYGVTEDSFKGGYNYSIAELAAIYHSRGFDYICYVQGDCLPTNNGFVENAIASLEADERILIVSPASEVNTWHNNFGYDQEMSDQMWVARVNDLLKPEICSIPGTDPNYPFYGGNSFEHMVGKYLKASGRYRLILEQYSYLHPAF